MQFAIKTIDCIINCRSAREIEKCFSKGNDYKNIIIVNRNQFSIFSLGK